MAQPRAYEEVVEFIAARIDTAELLAYHPSPSACDRVAALLERNQAGELDADEQSELDHYLQLEHLLRLAKARARRNAGGEAGN